MKKVITISFQGDYELAYVNYSEAEKRYILATDEKGSYIQTVKITKEEAERLVDTNKEKEKDGKLGIDNFYFCDEETVKETKNTKEVYYVIASYLLANNLFEATQNLFNKFEKPNDFETSLKQLIGINNENYNKSFKRLNTLIKHILNDEHNRFDLVIIAGYELLHLRNNLSSHIGKAEEKRLNAEVLMNY